MTGVTQFPLPSLLLFPPLLHMPACRFIVYCSVSRFNVALNTAKQGPWGMLHGTETDYYWTGNPAAGEVSKFSLWPLWSAYNTAVTCCSVTIIESVCTWYRDAFWSIRSQVDEREKFPFTPGVLICRLCPLFQTIDTIERTTFAKWNKNKAGGEHPL